MVLLIQISTNERGRFEQIGRLLGALRPLYTRAGTFHHFSLFLSTLCANTVNTGAPQLTEPQVNTAPPVVSPSLLTGPQPQAQSQQSQQLPCSEDKVGAFSRVVSENPPCLWIPT